MKVLVTGASGFVGSHLVRSLSEKGYEVAGTVRPGNTRPIEGSWIEADSNSDFSKILTGFDALVHAAGVAHNPTSDPDELKVLFAEGNREWTRRLAAAVSESDVRVMIHISSIAAAGKWEANGDRGFREEDETEPETDYGRSKREAEPFVAELGEKGKLGVNLRPPLIYGSGTKGNWAKIMALAKTSLPIPFGSVRNRRSYLGIDNLCDLVGTILEKSDRVEKSGTYHVADDGTYSLQEIIEALRAGLGRRAGLAPFPPGIMRNALAAMGRKKMAEGLFDDLVLDTSAVKEAFDWKPDEETLPSVSESIAKGAGQ
ncbi:MAG: NAD-dependent epimerase/dehydratase family protein [Verrucomicrobiota bacterium]